MEALLTKFKIVFTDKEFVIVPVNYLLSLNVGGIKESRHMKLKEQNEWQTGNTINGGRLLISIMNPAAINY